MLHAGLHPTGSSIAGVPVAEASRPTGRTTRLLQVLVVATVALAPNEGYLLAINDNLGKLVPAILGLAWLLVLVDQRRLPRWHPVYAPIAGLAAVVVASTAVNVGAQPYAFQYMVRWLPFLAITVILVDTVSREVPVRLLLGSAVAGATVAAGGALYSFLVVGAGRAHGPLDDPNDLAYVLVAALPLLVAMLPAGRRPKWALPVALAVAALLALGASATLSRGAAIAVCVAGFWLLARSAIPLKLVIGVSVLVGVLLVGAFYLVQPVIDSALGQKSYVASSNVEDRALRWQQAARMLGSDPLFGVGPGGFRHHYVAVSHDAEPAEPTPVVHNMYVEVGAELGIFGFAGFVLVIGVALLATELALRRGAPRQVVVAVQASLAAVLTASLFLSEEYYMPLWSMIAVACALHRRTLT